jgi:hypothetical protein
MKKWIKVFLVLVGLAVLAIAAIILLTPSMDRWGAIDAEIQATFPGDELVPSPLSFVNHAVTINATPERIYPWLVQMGADKGGLYSYTALETLINCPQTNARGMAKFTGRRPGQVVPQRPRPAAVYRCTDSPEPGDRDGT